MKAKIFQTHNKGFTLIELLVVVAIIGILAAIVLTALSSAREKTRDAKRISELRQLVNAIEMYRLDNNGNAPLGFCYTYSPSCLDELVDGVFAVATASGEEREPLVEWYAEDVIVYVHR